MNTTDIKRVVSKPSFIKVTALILGIILSITVLSPILSNANFHTKTLDIINRNKNEAMTLSALVTIASTVLSTLPEDTASPLADELSDLSTPLLIIVCILYFELFLLTALESFSFSILVPAALILLIMHHFTKRKSFSLIATKLILIALVCSLLIPLSASLTGMIEETFSQSIKATFSQIENVKNAFSDMGAEEGTSSILSFISDLANGIGVFIDLSKNLLSLMIDAIAILLITSCVIPAITLVFFIWSIKIIIVGKMENIQDTAMDVIKRLPKTHKTSPDTPHIAA